MRKSLCKVVQPPIDEPNFTKQESYVPQVMEEVKSEQDKENQADKTNTQEELQKKDISHMEFSAVHTARVEQLEALVASLVERTASNSHERQLQEELVQLKFEHEKTREQLSQSESEYQKLRQTNEVCETQLKAEQETVQRLKSMVGFS